MKSIDWSPRPARSLICPICDQRSEMEHVMRSEPFNPWLGKVALSLYHCAACGSYHYPDAREPSYESFGEQNGQYDASYVKFYVEQGCGLDSMIAPFFAVERSRIKSYLEIGCGFGMALDFAGRGLGWRALGLEPSMIGSTGAALLGTRVEPIYLKTGTRLEDGPFDLVMASEVIEHVTDPGAFLDGIGHALSAQGALVLTTPNAAAVSRETPESALVPILTPGMHMVLFTAESLRLLLQKHGYPHVTVKDTGYGLLAVATREPMAVDLEDSFDHRLYQAYLRERFETLSGQTRLASGFGYRLLKSLVNQGDRAGGLEAFEALRARVEEWYGFDLADPEAVIRRLPQDADLDQWVESFPVNICGIAFFRSIIASTGGEAPAVAEAYCSLAQQAGKALSPALAELGLVDGEVEDLTWRAGALRLGIVAHNAPAETVLGGIALARDATIRRHARIEACGELVQRLCDEGYFIASQALLLELEGKLAHSALAEPEILGEQIAGELEFLRASRAHDAAAAETAFNKLEEVWRRDFGLSVEPPASVSFERSKALEHYPLSLGGCAFERGLVALNQGGDAVTEALDWLDLSCRAWSWFAERLASRPSLAERAQAEALRAQLYRLLAMTSTEPDAAAEGIEALFEGLTVEQDERRAMIEQAMRDIFSRLVHLGQTAAAQRLYDTVRKPYGAHGDGAEAELLHAFGLYALNQLGRPDQAEHWFHAAHKQALRVIQAVGPDEAATEVGLLWLAKYHEAFAAVQQREAERALATLDTLAAAEEPVPPAQDLLGRVTALRDQITTPSA